MVKRSPRYPRQNLAKSIEMTRKLFAGAHQSRVDVDAAARVIGYSGSTGGAAASALGALRQYGLVDGLRGDMRVSDLAMRILQPMDDSEQIAAMREAATKPEIFGRIISQFGGRLPGADDPIRSYLIRQEGFSPSGADELIATARDTLGNLPEQTDDMGAARGSEPEASLDEIDATSSMGTVAPMPASGLPVGELITLPLGQNCKAELRLIGEVNAASYARLIRHLELLRDIASEEGGLD